VGSGQRSVSSGRGCNGWIGGWGRAARGKWLCGNWISIFVGFVYCAWIGRGGGFVEFGIGAAAGYTLYDSGWKCDTEWVCWVEWFAVCYSAEVL
jgi:hypothetical protein